MAAPQIKALSLLAIVIGVSGVAFQLFLENSNGELNSVMNIGGTGVEAMSGLFIVFAIGFLYHSFR